MDRRNEEEQARDVLTGGSMMGVEMDFAAASGVSLSGQERSADPVNVVSPELCTDEGEKLKIGPQNEWEVTLPLSVKEAFFTTSQQRVRIGRTALNTILEENPESRRWGFSRMRDEIIRRTGLHDAAASLVVFARKYELEETPE
ncbi:MAG: hypothetical protein ACRDRX_08905 [Pseudonocardiaceae bacterium]